VSGDEMYQRGELTRQKVLSPAYLAGTASEPSPILRAFYDYTIRGAWAGCGAGQVSGRAARTRVPGWG
jgi:hypothetical protein